MSKDTTPTPEEIMQAFGVDKDDIKAAKKARRDKQKSSRPKSTPGAIVVKVIITIVESAAIAIFLYSFLKLNILAWYYNLAIVAVLSLLLFFTIFKFWLSKKARLGTKVFCGTLAVIVAFLCAFGYYYVGSINTFIGSMVSNVRTTELDITKDPFTIYISGSDSRSSVDDTGSRSDVNLLLVVNPKEGKLLIVNTPRDYYVQLHGTTPGVDLKDKLTHAGYYGIETSKATLEDLYGIDIDYTVKVSFDTVVDVVNAIGGIDIYSDAAFEYRDTEYHPDETCYFHVGTQHVDGLCALYFSRERMAYDTGDMHRGENQQQVLSKILEKIVSPAYIINFPSILSAADGTFHTSFTFDEITSFIRHQISTGTKWQTESISVTGDAARLPTYSMGPNDPRFVFIPNEDSVNAAKKKIDEYLAN